MSQPPAGGHPPQGSPPPIGGPQGFAPPGNAPHYRLKKSNTILIVGLVLGAIAILGLLAAVVLGGDEGTPQAAEPGQAPAAGAREQPLPTGTLRPSPVGQVPPPAPPPPGGDPQPSAAPSPASQPTGPPGTPPPGPPASGNTIVLGDNVARIPVPSGWEGQSLQDGSQMQMSDGQGHNYWAGVFNTDPATGAAELLAQNGDALIGSENYAQLETGEVRTIPPSGALVSVAVLEYQGLVTDNQATFEVGGLLLMAVRQDGSVLAMTPEVSPAENVGTEEFAEGFNQVYGPIISGAIASFGG